MDDIVERLREASHNKALDIGTAWELLAEAADETERLRASVSAALPWLCSMEHMGSLVDHESLSKDIDKLTAALGWVRNSA